MLRIRNWEKFQHYKDRNPPWIKLHKDLLMSEQWVIATDAQRALLIAIMLLAARNDNAIPENPAYIQKVAHLDETPDLSWLVDVGFCDRCVANATVSVANATVGVADATQNTPFVYSETETEAETEKSIGHPPPVDDRFDDFWSIWPKKVQKKTAQTAWKNMTKKNREAALAALPAHMLRWNDPQFIPNPATWLRAERWNDELSPTGRWPASNQASGSVNDPYMMSLAKSYGASAPEIVTFFEEYSRTPASREEFERWREGRSN